MQPLNQNLILTLGNGSVSTDMSQSLTSNAVDVQDISNFAVQNFYTSTPAGALTLQTSLRILPGNVASTNPLDWSNISVATLSMNGNTMWNFSARGMKYIRVIWVPTGGSAGALSAIINLQTT